MGGFLFRGRMLPYHSMDIGGGDVREGIFNFAPYLDEFHFPDMKGKRVLDVGTGDGYFAFEFERRGAEVLAVDIRDMTQMDGPRSWSWGRYTRDDLIPFEFDSIKRELKSGVEFKEISVYDLSPGNVGKFDVVFCGDLLLHLTDPVKALFRMKQVCRGVTIVSTPIYDRFQYMRLDLLRRPFDIAALTILRNRSMVFYRGALHGGAFWVPTRKGLEGWYLSCGFNDVEVKSVFRMDRKHAKVDIRSRAVIHGS